MALTTAIGALLGAKNSSLSNRTGTSTSTTTPAYTPGQTSLQDQVLSFLSGGLTNPDAGWQPVEAAGIDTINKGYNGTLDAMNRTLASRGFTSSGKTGLNTEKLLSQRMGDVSSFEGNLAGQKMNRQTQLLSDAMNAAYKPSSTTTSGTTVAPGNTGAGALSGGFASLMASLNQALAMGGGGGG